MDTANNQTNKSRSGFCHRVDTAGLLKEAEGTPPVSQPAGAESVQRLSRWDPSSLSAATDAAADAATTDADAAAAATDAAAGGGAGGPLEF